MKNIILALILMVLPFGLYGETVYLYDSWDVFNSNNGDTVDRITVCKINKSILYDLKCSKEDKKLSKRLKKEVIVAKSDSLVLINSAYLKRRFNCLNDGNNLAGYLPFYYSDKIQYVKCNSKHMRSMSGVVAAGMLGGFIGAAIAYGISEGSENDRVMYYILDFRNHKVVKIDHNELKKLLEIFSDIKEAFVKTQEYKRQSVVNHYFGEYVKALHCEGVYNFVSYTEASKK